MSALTLDGGGYQLNITNGTGTAGVNWDLLSVGGGAGTVDLSGAGAGSITVRVTCALAALPNFDYTAGQLEDRGRRLRGRILARPVHRQHRRLYARQ
jgi:hypothetical protein